MQNRTESEKLLHEYIENPALAYHCEMVAKAMEAYARQLELPESEVEEWWTAGILHDLDWEKYPDEHPNKAIKDILPQHGYPQSIVDAIAAHAPQRTGKSPDTPIEKYLFACDEICGFIHASALIRPDKYQGMEVKSIQKKLKDKKFAAGVSREDIRLGAELIGKDLNDHIQFLLNLFASA